MAKLDFREGEVITINKPYKVSSFGALAFARTRISNALNVKRVKTGHAGTLDPLATGVLILCTGKATKKIEQLMLDDKEYTATLQFGATTPSFDMEHEEDEWFEKEHITEEMLREALTHFVGDIDQVPPVFSACNVNGKRAYQLARKDREVELKAKKIHIEEIELLWFDDEKKQAQIRVVCGKGTYIRSLARDLGKAVGSGAYLTQLCRTRVGKYKIEDCLTFDNFEEWLSQQELVPYE